MKNLKSMTLAAFLAVFLVSPAFAETPDAEGSEGKGKHWEKVDTDSDGFISEEEFLARHKIVFKELDADTDGKLSKEEMKEGMSKRREKMKELKAAKDSKVKDSGEMEPAPVESLPPAEPVAE